MIESDLIAYSACSRVGTPPSLVLAPHPDDEVLGCGGAIIRHTQVGDSVDVVVVTDGRLGVTDPGLSDDDAKRLRADESQHAALILGYGRPAFWSYPDRSLACDERLVERLCATIRAGQYNSIFVPSPFEIHPDHRALSLAMISVAARCERDFELCFYEVGVPLFPNRLLDITDIVDRKREAMRRFSSQLAAQNYLDQCEGLNRFRTYTLPRTVTHAEAFCLLRSADLPRYAREPLALPPFCRTDLDARVTSLYEEAVRTRAFPEDQTRSVEAVRNATLGRLAKPLRELWSLIRR